MFEPFPALVAFTPLILYVLCFALIRVSGKVFVTSGACDTAAVLFAISGLVVIGPMELFFPKATAYLLGVWVWVPLFLLYFLFGCLFVISGRAKLVVYGRTSDQLFAALTRAANSLDDSAATDHDQQQVTLPKVGVHLRLDSAPGHDCISVVSFEPSLSEAFWRHLKHRLRNELRTTSPPYPRRGLAALGIALMMSYWLVRYIVREPAQMVDGFREWLIR